MAAIQKAQGGRNHSLHPKGMKSHAPDVQDDSRVWTGKPTVNDEAVRTGVAVGADGNKKKDSGVLK